MITITKIQKKRLAKEYVNLALECITGGPKLNNSSYYSCAIGEGMKRAKLAPKQFSKWEPEHFHLASEIDMLLVYSNAAGRVNDFVGIVTRAVTERDGWDNKTAVVVPLLALSDELLKAT